MAGNEHGSSPRTGRWQHFAAVLAFACAMGLALFLRLHRIGEEGFHWDEALTLRAFFGLYERGFIEAFQASREIDPPMTPVYFLVQYAWGQFVGLTALRMHLLSVLFSAATFVAVFFTGRKLKGTSTGIAAMLFLAVSPIHVYYSPEIRNYSLTALLAVLSTLTLLRGVERPTGRAWALNFAVDVLLAMSHLFANLLFVPQALFLLACHRRRAVLLPWVVSHTVVAAVLGGWLASCDFAAIRSAASYMEPLSWQGAHDMVAALAGASYAWVGPTIGVSGLAGGLIIALFLAALFAFPAEWLVFRKGSAGGGEQRNPLGPGHGVVLVLLTVAVPPALLAAITLVHTHCFLARYVLCSAVATPLLLACAVTMLRPALLRILLAAFLVVANGFLLVQEISAPAQRGGWMEVRRFLGEAVRKEDYLVIFSSDSKGFSSMIEMMLPVTPKRTMRKEVWSARDLEELAAWHSGGIKTWCVTAIDYAANTEFETLLGAYDLPFSKHEFTFNRHVLYCIPAAAGPFVTHGDSVNQTPLGSGRLRGWFAVDPGFTGSGMGVTQLAAAEHPYAPIFLRPSLCLQSVVDGRSGELWPAWDASQAVPIELQFCSSSCVESGWPVNARANRLECRMRHSFSGRNHLDMCFEVTPGGMDDGQSPLVFTWVSHVRGACSPAIHFPGVRDGVEGWVSFGESPGERGIVVGLGAGTQAGEGEKMTEACRPVQGVRFSEPVYYGLVDGDQNEATGGDVMVFILMFDQPENTGFVLRDGENDSRGIEWDWQYRVPAPEAGKAFSQRVRMVYKPFLGQDDVLAEYRSWRDTPACAESTSAQPRVSPLALPGPDREESDPVGSLGRLAHLDPKKALDAYEALFETPLYRVAAADGIDACCLCLAGPDGLAEEWESLCARDGQDALAWSRLGAARNRAGDTGKAVEAYARGLEKDPRNEECLLGLTALRFVLGDIEAAVELAGSAVRQNPALGKAAADLCSVAARARFAAGDSTGAMTACRAALRFVPQEIASKMLMGRLLVGSGEVEGGFALFGEVIAADPNLTEPVAEACSAIAETCIKAGNVPGAAAVLRRVIACSSHKSNYRMALGQALEAAKDDEGALSEYLTAMAESPESQIFSGRIDMIFEKRKDIASRVETWRRLVDACPTAITPRAHLCMALESAGDLAGAETVTQAILQRDPGNGSAKIQLGKLRVLRNDIAGGLALIKEAASAQPDLAELAARACNAAAKARLELGDTAGAGEVLQCAHALVPATCEYAVTQAGILETLGDMKGAEAAYRDALKCDPGNVPAKIRLGALLVAGGDANGGRTLIEAAIAAQPGGAGQAAEACATAAKQHMADGDASGAATALRRALSLTPNVLGYRADLAAALEAAGDPTAALAEYRTVVGAAPESPKSSARIDALLEGNGDKGARVDLWKQMVAAHPYAVIPKLHLGLALETLGDAAGAEAAYQAALSRDPRLASESALFNQVKDKRKEVQ